MLSRGRRITRPQWNNHELQPHYVSHFLNLGGAKKLRPGKNRLFVFGGGKFFFFGKIGLFAKSRTHVGGVIFVRITHFFLLIKSGPKTNGFSRNMK